MSLVIVWVAGGSVQILVASPVSSRNGHARLGRLSDEKAGVKVVWTKAHVTHTRTTAAANNPLPLIRLARVLLVLALV